MNNPLRRNPNKMKLNLYRPQLFLSLTFIYSLILQAKCDEFCTNYEDSVQLIPQVQMIEWEEMLVKRIGLVVVW